MCPLVGQFRELVMPVRPMQEMCAAWLGQHACVGLNALKYLDARVCLQVFVLHDMCLCQLKTVCLVWLNSVSTVTNVEFSKVTFNLRVSLPTRLNALNSLMLWPEKQAFCYGAERRNAKGPRYYQRKTTGTKKYCHSSLYKRAVKMALRKRAS